MIIFQIFKKLNRDMGDKKTQIKLLEMETAVPELKNTPQSINSRLDLVKEKICELEDIAVEIEMKTRAKKESVKMQSIGELCNNCRLLKICEIGVCEGKRTEEWIKKIYMGQTLCKLISTD